MKLLKTTVLCAVLAGAGAASAQTNLALGRPVTVSSTETAAFGGALAVDGNATTRWASAYSDPQWIRVDLQSVVTLSRVVLRWEAAFGRAYQVQVSNDGSSWTNVFSTTTGDGGVDDLAVTGSGRYVRVHGTQRGTAWGYSLFEVEIYGPTGPTPTPAPTATPTPVPPNGNLALGRPATVSSVEDASLGAALAFDGNLTTRWASATSDPQWIRVDLGSPTTIGRVVLRWEAAFGRAYQIQVSNDDANWTSLFTTTTGDGGVDDVAVSGSGRYVRVHGTQRGTEWGYSLFEVEVYGTAGPTPVPTVTPTPTPTVTVPTPTPTPTPVVATPTPTPGGTRPVDINGQLRVCGTKLCNASGRPIQLRGMSTHGLQWYYQCINNNSMDALVNDWGADVIRISLYVQEGGYETDPVGFKQKVDTIVDYAVSRGIYLILDWHMLTPGDPMFNLDRAREYFTYMTQRHGNKPNVLYEICNEPNGVNWARIRDYAHQIIPTIRSVDPDGVVLVGTRAWSSLGMSDGSNAQEIVSNPVSATNIMYVFHMYAASHGQSYLNELSWAADRLPMFVTEWGTQTASGDGANNFTMSQAYVDLMRTKQISWVSWNYSDDNRSGASFLPGTCPSGPFTGTSRLKPAGVWIRERILNPPDVFPTN